MELRKIQNHSLSSINDVWVSHLNYRVEMEMFMFEHPKQHEDFCWVITRQFLFELLSNLYSLFEVFDFDILDSRSL